MTLSISESCTGGKISSSITDVPGSSECFFGGFVVYNNYLKMNILGVKESTLREHGAVSGQCAREMVQGTMDRTKTDIAFSVTGIAGPAGGTNEKPVGTVFMALKRKGMECILREFHLDGLDRMEFKEEVERLSLKMISNII